jgi:hypothetical protein
MSMEMYVLSDTTLSSIDVWQRMIEARGFRMRLSTERTLAELRGALPVLLDGELTSFECDHWDASDVLAERPNIDFGHAWRHALAFRWGGDLSASVAAGIAAACYAEASEGVVFEGQEGKVLTAQQALDMARTDLQQMPLIAEMIAKAVARFRN